MGKYRLLFILIAILNINSSIQIRILHIGVDGVLQKCLNKSNHSVFDSFKANGSYTFKARTAIETISAPGWSNILCGMSTAVSGVYDNDWKAPWVYGNSNPLSTINNSKLPCIFDHLKAKNNNIRTGYITDWEWFVNLSNVGYPKSIDYDFYCNTENYPIEKFAECDFKGLKKVKSIIESKDFDYLFYYIGAVDEQGHATGFCSDNYIKMLTIANNIIESIFSSLKKAEIFEETVIIWNTDHGASYLTTNHGDQTDENLLVPWMIRGPGIKKGYEIRQPVKNLDTPAVISKLLNVEKNILWESQDIEEIFESQKINNLK